MSRPPSTSRRSGKNKLNRHLHHRRNTRVQLIRQHKSCNLSLPSAQVANELPGPSGTVPLAIPWIRPTPRYQCQSLRLSVRPSSRAVRASLWPMARIEILSAAAKQLLAYLPPSASCKHINMFNIHVIFQQNKQTVYRTNPSWYFLWVTKPTLKYQLKPTEALFFFRAWSRHPRPLSYRLDWSLSRALRSELPLKKSLRTLR